MLLSLIHGKLVPIHRVGHISRGVDRDTVYGLDGEVLGTMPAFHCDQLAELARAPAIVPATGWRELWLPKVQRGEFKAIFHDIVAFEISPNARPQPILAHESDFEAEAGCLASTYGGSLRVWMDSFGLAFEAALAPSWSTISIMQAVRHGVFRAASFMNVGDGKGVVETLEEGGRLVHEIRRLNVNEISITTTGANPSACAWLGDETAAELPAWVADARARWAIGRQGRYLAAHRPKAQAKAKPPASVMKSVARCLAMADRRR